MAAVNVPQVGKSSVGGKRGSVYDLGTAQIEKDAEAIHEALNAGQWFSFTREELGMPATNPNRVGDVEISGREGEMYIDESGKLFAPMTQGAPYAWLPLAKALKDIGVKNAIVKYEKVIDADTGSKSFRLLTGSATGDWARVADRVKAKC